MHPSLKQTWDVDDVRNVLREALDLVDELHPPDDLRADTYRYAVQMRSQVAVAPTAVSLGGDGLLGLR